MIRIAIDHSQVITAGNKAAELLRLRQRQLRHRRDRAIAGGITLAGMAVATDDLSQARIMAAAISAMLDPGYAVQWKTAAGFVTLDAAQVLAIAQAIRAHVQACFDHEAVLLAAMASDLEVDLDAGWP